MKKTFFVAGLATLSLMHATAFAHSGKTDASGCHTEKKTGNYHCHGGSSATVAKQAKTQAKTAAKTTAKPVSGVAQCVSDVYNCPHFTTHAEAQNIFEQCLKQTGRDVHGLDGDNDGIACETLP